MASFHLELSERSHMETLAGHHRDHPSTQRVERKRADGDLWIEDSPGAERGAAPANQLDDLVRPGADRARIRRIQPANPMPAIAAREVRLLRTVDDYEMHASGGDFATQRLGRGQVDRAVVPQHNAVARPRVSSL